jgi:Peptidase family M41/C-terminal, D2-small domain, of ClpB protein
MISKDILIQREEKLQKAHQNLKKKFIGIDYIIDRLIEYVRIWYLVPEAMTKPVIVNLWGMTGVGKTDLVRTLVSELEMKDKFAETEMHNSESSRGSVQTFLEDKGIVPGDQNIILFDEFQRYRTVDEEGKEQLKENLSDIWELLSDGRISRKEYLNYAARDLYRMIEHYEDNQKEGGKESSSKTSLNKIGLYNAIDLKNTLHLKENIFEIATMGYEQAYPLIKEAIETKKLYETMNYSKTLIFISGNLDEAYRIASRTAEAEVDADIFHNYTKRINLIDIKDALRSRFKPEHISRLGNIHLIYRSFTKKDYHQLIQRSIEDVIKRIKDNFDITLRIDQTINELIYQNGVFPVQGVRPVFSTVTDILETNLAPWIIASITEDSKSIELKYNSRKSKLVAILQNDKILEREFVGTIEKVRNSQSLSQQWITAIHESGHALIYAMEFGVVPLQLKSRLASGDKAGFTMPHSINENQKNILSRIRVYLAGTLAESILLGEEKRSVGHETDLEEATRLASRYVRSLGFGDNQAFTAKASANNYHFRTDVESTDEEVENIIKQQRKEALEILKENKEALENLSKKLFKNGTLSPKEIKNILKKDNIESSVEGEGYTVS